MILDPRREWINLFKDRNFESLPFGPVVTLPRNAILPDFEI